VRATRRRNRGTTLIEILISVAVVLVGMLALFQTLGTSVTGSSTASKLSQAQQRAVMVMENIRIAPSAALECLRTTAALSWDACEATCRAQFPGTPSQDLCVYKTLVKPNTGLQSDHDYNRQNYFLVYKNDPHDNKPGGGISQVTLQGVGGRVYDAQVVIGWRDDNDPDPTKYDKPDHFVVLRSGVFN
jgi:type II secretory pathway pseudopilin PulG